MNSKENLKKGNEKCGQNFDQNDNKYRHERILIYVITKITNLKWNDHHKTKKILTEYSNRNIWSLVIVHYYKIYNNII